MNQIKLQEFANLFDVFICRDSNNPNDGFYICEKEPIFNDIDENPEWNLDTDKFSWPLSSRLFSDAETHDYKTLIRPENKVGPSLEFIYPQDNIAEEINFIDTKLECDSVIESDSCLYKITAIVRNISFSNVLKDVYVIDSSIDNACRKVEEYFKEDFIEIIKIKIKGIESIKNGSMPKLLQ